VRGADARGYVPHGGNPDRFAGPDGTPLLSLILYRDLVGEQVLRLCEDATDLLVSPSDERLARMGIHVAQLQGEWTHQAACEISEIRPGSRVRLVRERLQDLDVSVVAVYDATGQHLLGHVNKSQARALVQLLEAGDRVEAIALRGTEAGTPCDAVAILAASPRVLQHLLRRLPALPRPAAPAD
jgi:hypothetical protein